MRGAGRINTQSKKEEGKRKKLVSRYYILAVLLVLLALLANYTSVLAIDYEKVGVKVGDTADYETSLTGHGEDRTRILVYGIIGTAIYLNLTYYYANGTVGSEYQISGDVFVGAGSPPLCYTYLQPI